MRTTIVALLLALSTPAQAARWIVRNPRILPLGAGSVKTLRFDGERFTAFTLPEGARPPRGAVPDFEIGPMDEPLQRLEGPERPDAWHVQKLHYNDLPAAADGHDIVVAVLDDGVKYMHPALAGQMWVNAGEVAGNHKDDDGNGYVDDVYGYDFVERKGDPQGRISASHGTFCAGLIAATTAPEGKAQGIAPGARIMALRILGGPEEKRPTFISTAAEAIKYAVDNGARVISNSWRIYRSWNDYHPTPENLALLDAAIEYAAKRGVLYVAGAGNEGIEVGAAGTDTPYPVALPGHPNLVGVAASDPDDARAGFSNFGALFVQFAAPGVAIASTESYDSWATSSGTSYSTPIVAGLLARGLSAGMAPLDALRRLLATSRPGDAWKDKVAAGGVVDPVRFLEKNRGAR